MIHVLIVDSDRNRRNELGDRLERMDVATHTAGSVEEALSCLRHRRVEATIAQLAMSDGSALDLLAQTRIRRCGRFVIVTEDPEWKRLLHESGSRRLTVLAPPLENGTLRKLVSQLVAEVPPRKKVPGGMGLLLGESEAMREVYRMIARVAPTDATVLLTGESGTGKELVAHTIHDRSSRRDKRFIAINCGAIPENLIESELFGHEKGAFTGADRVRLGVFERARGGTLLLDEVTEMPVDMQVRLLRVLEQGVVTRVGGDQEVKVNVRVIAATNRDPEKAVADGGFREDLLYRLAVFPIRLPPLSARGDDILLLANHVLDACNTEASSDKRLTDLAARRLRAYHWPGNVRQLRNMLRRAFILEDEHVDMDCLVDMLRDSQEHAGSESPAKPGEESVAVTVGASIAVMEQKLILSTLEQYQGDKKKTAEVLGISLKTLYNRLNEYASQAVAG